ncbi:MAG: DUF2148 domain-containing protein [Bacteroidales bacterium]|nr:DUF2148 domain-containing protein [Bacteroidales bacterium]
MIKPWKEINLENFIIQLEWLIQAAKTAPKARGLDQLQYVLVYGEDLEILSAEMEKIAQEYNLAFFSRDAQNIRHSQAVILIGTSNVPKNINCHYCGFKCSEKPEKIACVMNVTDLGIAIGSMVSLASTFHIDNRIMYSAGKAALQLGWLPGATLAFAIPFSVSQKSIYFDRK